MKLTKSERGLAQVDEDLTCPRVIRYSGIVEFFETDDSELYKFSTLCHAQHTTQALLYKMMQQLDTTNDWDDWGSDSEEEEETEDESRMDEY